MRLLGMHLRRRAQDRRVDAGLRQRFGEIRGDVLDAVFVGDLLRLLRVAARPARRTSTPSIFLMPSRCLMPNAPAPASTTFMCVSATYCFPE